jgi:hypothetical protein
MLGKLSFYSGMETEGSEIPVFFTGSDTFNLHEMTTFRVGNGLSVYNDNGELVWDGIINSSFPFQDDLRAIPFNLDWCKKEFNASLI